MNDTVLPSISRKSAISLTSESDPNDYRNSTVDSSVLTSGAAQSLSSSPLKFPIINRSNSTNVARAAGSQAIRHRSQTREQRSLHCRSPSCPSHLNINRDIKRDHNNKFKRNSPRDIGTYADNPSHVSLKPDNDSMLPSIFNKHKNDKFIEKPKTMTSRREIYKDTLNNLSLETGESIGHKAFEPGISSKVPLSSRDPVQRHNQGTALLLPIRTTTKKKKRRSRIYSASEGEQQGEMEELHRNLETDYLTTRSRFKYETEDPLDAIARENDIYDDSEDTRALEISSSRKVKQWMNNNQNANNERQIKT